MNQIFRQITTERLIIKPLILADASAYHAAEIASAEIMAPYWSWVDQNKPLSDIEDFLRDAEKAHAEDRPSMMFFGIFTKHNRTFCGCIWYAGINWFVPKFEIAYWQENRQSGNGYMTEAVNALTRTTFKLYQAKRVDIKIFVNNKKSRALAERLGFKLEAIMENYFIDFVTNEIIDGALYACSDIKQLPKLDLQVLGG